MNLLKNWKIHFMALILAVIAEWIGVEKDIGRCPGVLLFLPMLYAMILGAFISWPKIKVLKESETKHATEVLGLLTLLLVTKLGIVIGAIAGENCRCRVCLVRTGIGAFSRHGNSRFCQSPSLWAWAANPSGATFSIDREPNIAIIAEKYGLNSTGRTRRHGGLHLRYGFRCDLDSA